MSAGARGPAPEGPRRPRGRPSCPPPPRAAMDAAPELLRVPPAELLDDVLREQFGPLPQQATICRLKRLPSSTQDVQLVLERRRVANAKERERVSSGRPRWVPAPEPGRLPPGSPPRPASHFRHLGGPGSPPPPWGPGAAGTSQGPPGSLPPARAGASPVTHLELSRKPVWGGRGEPPTASETPPAGRCFKPSEAAGRFHLPTSCAEWVLGAPFTLRRSPNGAWDR